MNTHACAMLACEALIDVRTCRSPAVNGIGVYSTVAGEHFGTPYAVALVTLRKPDNAALCARIGVYNHSLRKNTREDTIRLKVKEST